MTIRFDEKGKFFTKIISKETIWAVIQTTSHRIEGYLHVRPGERIKDELNRAEQFLAVTEAVILSPGGEELYQCDFLSVNRNHIIWILPYDRSARDEEKDGSELAGGEA